MLQYPSSCQQDLLVALVPNIIQSGFESTGIFPFNRDIFPNARFALAKTII